MSLPRQRILKAHPLPSATFTLPAPVCANARQAEIEFDKKEIDSRVSDSGVVRLLRWG